MGEKELDLGGDTFAFFTRNPRGGKAKDIDEQDVQELLALIEEKHFGVLVAHAPYTMNLCAAKEDIREFSENMLADDLLRMEYVPGNYYNFHPGSHVGQGEIGEEALRRVVTHPALQGKPFILETPNNDDGYRREISIIREWMTA